MSGYALTGLTQAHSLFFMHGVGANGKSTFINAITGCVGDYHRTAPIETFIASTQERHPTDLAGLRGARLVTAVETDEGRRWNESKIKALTGGDKVAARFMRQDFFEFVPQFKLLFAGNHKPGLQSVDEAIRRRIHLIPFTVTIPPEERDEDLAERLRTEWPGILAWAIAGCLEWQEHGLAPPEAVTAATGSYLEAEDAIAAWMDERCQRRSDVLGEFERAIRFVEGLGRQGRRACRKHEAVCPVPRKSRIQMAAPSNGARIRRACALAVGKRWPMTHVTGVPLIDVTRARDGQIRICRHMRHYMPEVQCTRSAKIASPRRPSGRGKVILNSGAYCDPKADGQWRSARRNRGLRIPRTSLPAWRAL